MRVYEFGSTVHVITRGSGKKKKCLLVLLFLHVEDRREPRFPSEFSAPSARRSGEARRGGLLPRDLCLVVAVGALSLGAAASGPCPAGGGTVVHGGGYGGDCVGGARTVCAAFSSNLYGLCSGSMGSDGAVSLLSPRVVFTCGPVAGRAWRSLCWWRCVYGGWRAHGTIQCTVYRVPSATSSAENTKLPE